MAFSRICLKRRYLKLKESSYYNEIIGVCGPGGGGCLWPPSLPRDPEIPPCFWHSVWAGRPSLPPFHHASQESAVGDSP